MLDAIPPPQPLTVETLQRLRAEAAERRAALDALTRADDPSPDSDPVEALPSGHGSPQAITRRGPDLGDLAATPHPGAGPDPRALELVEATMQRRGIY